jgi:Fe-S cluster biogenesis protein NfuA
MLRDKVQRLSELLAAKANFSVRRKNRSRLTSLRPSLRGILSDSGRVELRKVTKKSDAHIEFPGGCCLVGASKF